MSISVSLIPLLLDIYVVSSFLEIINNAAVKNWRGINICLNFVFSPEGQFRTYWLKEYEYFKPF